MLSPTIRHYVRKLFGWNPKSRPRAQGYLREFPWLGNFIPFGHEFSEASIRKVDLEILGEKTRQHGVPGLWAYRREIYAITKSGVVVTKAYGSGYLSSEIYRESVYNLLCRIQASGKTFDYLILKTTYVDSFDFNADITIGKFPRDKSPFVHAEELMNSVKISKEQEEMEKQKDEENQVARAQVEARQVLERD